MMRKGPLKGWHSFKVDVRGNDIIVRLTSANFEAVYYRPAARGRLVRRYQSRTDDHTLVSKAWIAATEKARELGWIE
jgi:hypothetical protein